MNNPITVNCPQGAWTKIATGVKNICIWRSDKSPAAYLMTYRISGVAAPSSQIEGQPLFLDNYYERIQSAYAVDVYIFAVGESGAIRVDEFLFLPELDILTNTGVDIDSNHHEIHEGNHYFYSRVTTLASGATGNWVLTSATKDLHFIYSVGSDVAGFTFVTIEDITADSDGTLLEINNNHRRKGDNSSAVLRYNPSNIATDGKRIMRDGSFGTSTNPAKSTAGSAVRSDEVILQAGLKYLLRVINLFAGNNLINVSMSWYEE